LYDSFIRNFPPAYRRRTLTPFPTQEKLNSFKHKLAEKVSAKDVAFQASLRG
jgi:hypothetical protein